MKQVFCNVGWMARYEGISGQPDRIVGGGRYVDEYQRGGEICNFLHCPDGYVYGHVETFKGDPGKDGYDRDIDIAKLGAADDDEYINGIDVIWTAKHPTQGERRVVGWYKNAWLYRERQHFVKAPSPQHRNDGLIDYRVRAKSSDAVLVSLSSRTLRLESGKKGWMGHAQWWFPEPDKHEDVAKFIDQVRAAIRSMDEDIGDNNSLLQQLGRVERLERNYIKRLLRGGQPAFRKAILRIYGGRCCLTGCSVERCLEAVHIDQFAKSGSNLVTNGILLRADLHRLFDSELLKFRDT